MYDYGPMMNGNDWGWTVLMMLFWFVVLVCVAVVVLRVLRDHDHQTGDVQKSDPLDIVNERYAKGEITKKQFDQLKEDLRKK